MHPELADKGVVGQHLGGMVGRHDDRLARGEDVEIVRVEHDPARAARPAMGVDRLPEIARVVMIDPVDIDQIGVAARLVADDAARLVAGDVDGEGEPVADRLARRQGPRRAPRRGRPPRASRRSAVSLNAGEPRRMRNCTRLEPVRTRMLNERGEISA